MPLRPDEDVYGVTYDQIDDFLEGRAIDEAARARILQPHLSTAHKPALPHNSDGLSFVGTVAALVGSVAENSFLSFGLSLY
jgi:hypothetical protein